MRIPVVFSLMACLAFSVAARAADAVYKVSGASLSPLSGIMEVRDSESGPVCDKPVPVGADDVILTLGFSIEPQFDDTHTSVTVKSSDPQFARLPSAPAFIGSWKSIGEFGRADSVTIQRPADWATRTATNKRFNVSFVYTAPKSVLGQQSDVTINGQKFTLNIAANTRTYSPGNFAGYSGQTYAVMADSIPNVDASKPALTNPNGKLVIVRTELSFTRGNDAFDAGAPLKVAYRNLNMGVELKDKSMVQFPLLGFLDAEGRFVAVDSKQLIEGAATSEKPLKRAHKFVFAISKEAQSALQIQMRLFNSFISSARLFPPVQLVKTEAVLDEIIQDVHVLKNNEPFFAPKVLTAPEGKKYLHVTAYCVPTLLEGTSDLNTSIEPSSIQLSDASKATIEPIGNWGSKALFGTYKGGGLSSWGKYDGTSPLTFNLVYLVPADSKTFTFELFHMKTTIAMPTTTERADGTKLFNFTIKSVKVVDSIDKYTNPNGKALLLSVEWTDNGRTDLNGGPNGYMSMAHNFLNLTWGDPAKPTSVQYIADVQSDGKTLFGYNGPTSSGSVTTSGYAKAAPTGIKQTITFVFPAPPAGTNFDLTYYGWKMASGTVPN